MEITLRPDVARFVEQKIRSGRFRDASDAVNEALTALREQSEPIPEPVAPSNGHQDAPPALGQFVGAGKGTYGRTPDEADRYLRELRNEWDT